MQQFARQFNLVIGNDKESISINNLRVAFNINKTSTAEPNPALITIHNLTQSHRNLITSKMYSQVKLFVGYSELSLIYSGDIIAVKTINSDLDFIMQLTCGDGYQAYTASFINKTLMEGMTDNDIVSAAAYSMKIAKKIVDLPNDRKLMRGKVLFGNPCGLLTETSKNSQADWSIQDGELIILPINKVLSDSEDFVLSQQTGMINNPERTDNGLEVLCLCNPNLKIGGLVRIESLTPEYNGAYKIVEITHTGDLMGDNWHSKITCTDGHYQRVK